MQANLLAGFYERDLLKVIEELNSYTDEKLIWALKPGINNSTGTLALHIAGNLLHFIGSALGNTGYVRERDKEFSLRDVSKNELIQQLNEARTVLSAILPTLNDTDLQKDFPLEKHGEIVSTNHMLTHLLVHLGYHLGQINYHRRLVGQIAE